MRSRSSSLRPRTRERSLPRHPVLGATRSSMELMKEAGSNAEVVDVPVPEVPTDITAQLERLAGLYERGLLTEEEFASQKARILGMRGRSHAVKFPRGLLVPAIALSKEGSLTHYYAMQMTSWRILSAKSPCHGVFGLIRLSN